MIQWVKVDVQAKHSPRVKLLAARLGLSVADVHLKLEDVWALAYQCSADAMIPGACVDAQGIDAMAERPGFADAMIAVNLAEVRKDGIYVKGTRDRTRELVQRLGAVRTLNTGQPDGDPVRETNEGKTTKRARTGHRSGSPVVISSSGSGDLFSSSELPESGSGFDLEAIYALYPNKRGKSRGMKIAERQVRSSADYMALRTAVMNYAADLKATGRYAMHFGTFMGEWRDWVAMGTPDVEAAPKPEANPLPLEFQRIHESCAWMEWSRLMDLETRIERAGFRPPWWDHPMRIAMTEDRDGYPVKRLGPAGAA